MCKRSESLNFVLSVQNLKEGRDELDKSKNAFQFINDQLIDTLDLCCVFNESQDSHADFLLVKQHIFMVCSPLVVVSLSY